MANRIIPKKSSVAAKVPLASDLSVGELAINLADKKLYSKDSGGAVIELGGGTAQPTSTAFTQTIELYGTKSPHGTVTNVSVVTGTENISFSDFWMGALWQGTDYGNSLALFAAKSPETLDKILAIPVGSTITANDGIQTYSGTVTSVVNRSGFLYIHMSNMSPDSYFTLYAGYVTIPSPTTELTLDTAASTWWSNAYGDAATTFPLLYAGDVFLPLGKVRSVVTTNSISKVTLGGSGYAISNGADFGGFVSETSYSTSSKSLRGYSSINGKSYGITFVDNYNWSGNPSWVIECPYDSNYVTVPPALSDSSTLITTGNIGNYAISQWGGTVNGSLSVTGNLTCGSSTTTQYLSVQQNASSVGYFWAQGGLYVGGGFPAKTNAIGYTGGGVGGAVTQTGSRTSSVTINKSCGQITLFSTTGSTLQTFIVNNTQVQSGDVIILSQKTGSDVYDLRVSAVGDNYFKISVKGVTGTISESPTINFALIKATNS